ncbi:type II toxin-antitoxin system prevent-host-death family antitoxin [Pseudoduganella sp. HUAS MS19]
MRGVSEGQRYTISVRGKPVADLVPAQARPQGDAQLAMDALRKLPKVKGAGGAELAAMIRERRE